MTATHLRTYTLKDLAQLAKRRGVNGWHTMRKDQLVRAILRVKKPKPVAKAASVKKASTPVRRLSSGKNGAMPGHGITSHGLPNRNGTRSRNGVAGRNTTASRNGSAAGRNGSVAGRVSSSRAAALRPASPSRAAALRRDASRRLAKRAEVAHRIEQAKQRLSRSEESGLRASPRQSGARRPRIG